MNEISASPLRSASTAAAWSDGHEARAPGRRPGRVREPFRNDRCDVADQLLGIFLRDEGELRVRRRHVPDKCREPGSSRARDPAPTRKRRRDRYCERLQISTSRHRYSSCNCLNVAQWVSASVQSFGIGSLRPTAASGCLDEFVDAWASRPGIRHDRRRRAARSRCNCVDHQLRVESRRGAGISVSRVARERRKFLEGEAESSC